MQVLQDTSDIKRILTFNQQLNLLVERRASNINSIEHRLDHLLVAMVMGKILKTHKAVLLLCDRGFGEDANVLVRTIFETAIDLLYIFKEKTDERLMRYASYGYIIKAKHLKTLADSHHHDSISKKETKNILDCAEQVRKKYNYKNGWSDKTKKDMAKNVGRLADYNIIYKFMSSFAHTDIEALNHYVNTEENGAITIGGGPDLVLETLISTLEYFRIIAEKWNEILKLGIENEIKTIIEDKYFHKFNIRHT